MRFNAYGVVAGSKYLGEVEARDVIEAREKAFRMHSASVNLCHQCADECEDAEIHEVIVESIEE